MVIRRRWSIRHLWSTLELFADKLPNKDGAGPPPQGRTVRAGPALPPGGARLLISGCCGPFPYGSLVTLGADAA